MVSRRKQIDLHNTTLRRRETGKFGRKKTEPRLNYISVGDSEILKFNSSM